MGAEVELGPGPEAEAGGSVWGRRWGQGKVRGRRLAREWSWGRWLGGGSGGSAGRSHGGGRGKALFGMTVWLRLEMR